MRALEVVDVDIDRLTDVDRHSLVAFEQTMWAECAREEPSMPEEPALWLATWRRPNATRVTFVVRPEAGNEMAGVATLSLPLSDNRHLGIVELRVAPPYRRQGIGHSLMAAIATRAKAEHRRVLAGFSWDLVPAGEAYARAVGSETRLVIRRSDLDWTLVQPSQLTDGPLTRRYRAGEHLPMSGIPTISRADAAHFMLDQVHNPAYVRRVVLLTY